jgi:hypothetical protein
LADSKFLKTERNQTDDWQQQSCPSTRRRESAPLSTPCWLVQGVTSSEQPLALPACCLVDYSSIRVNGQAGFVATAALTRA